MRQSFRQQAGRGSHLPVLIKLFGMTTGPILELGSGYCSTPYLHWACYPTKRRLVTYENQQAYYKFATNLASDFHEVHCITDWDAIDISEKWSIAFVDHEPGSRRRIEVSRLVHAEYVVVHDTENKSDRKFRFYRVFPLFKWRWKYGKAFPHTSVFSNFHDLSDFDIGPFDSPVIEQEPPVLVPSTPPVIAANRLGSTPLPADVRRA